VVRRDFLLLCAGALASAQEEDQAVFKTDVKVVNIFATVRTKKGEIVRDLAKADFSLTENGKPQQIRYFSKETDLPLTLGLLIDTSMSQEKVLNAERSASFRFLDQVLRDNKDQVFLLQFDLAIQIPQALTSSRRKLEDALAYVDTPTRQELMMGSHRGTVLYDSIVKASNEIMRGQRNRKALILLTDGVDVGSEASLTDAIEAAQRTDTLIYSILFSDSGYYSFFGGENGRPVLVKLARETGGSFFEVSKKLTIQQIYGAIENELRSQFSIGFVSDEPVRISEWRKLQLTTNQKGLQVQSRERYWAQR
jgi:VWFA-related protein